MNPTSADMSLDFTTDVRNAVLGLRGQLGEALAPRLSPPFQPIELHRELGVDRRLGWTISRFLQDEDLFEAARHFPGTTAIKRLLKRIDCDSESSVRITQASEAFAAVIERHAGDADAFDRLLAGNARADLAREKEREQRRQAFQANSYIYGVCALAQAAVYVLTPNSDGKTIDVAVVRGYAGLQRLVADRPWPLMARRWASEDGSINQAATFTPLDPSERADESAAPLLRDFCIPRDMVVEAVEAGPGIREYRLPRSGIGLAQAQACMIGERIDRAGARFATPADPIVTLSPTIRTPSEGLLLDCFVSHELGLGTPELALMNDVHRIAGEPVPLPERDALDPLCELRDMGLASRAAFREQRIAQHHVLLDSVFNMLGVDMSAYRFFRAWLPYPPIASTASLTFALPERGGAESAS